MRMVSRVPRSRWRHLGLPGAGLAGILLAWIGSAIGPFDPVAKQIDANWPGELLDTVSLIAIEVAVLYLVVRPWSYARSWGRALTAILVLAPFAAFAFSVLFMHGSPLALLHVIWLILVAGGLFVTGVISARAAVSETGQAAA